MDIRKRKIESVNLVGGWVTLLFSIRPRTSVFLSMRSNASFPNKTFNSVLSLFHSVFVCIPELPRSNYINFCYAIYSSSVTKVYLLLSLSYQSPHHNPHLYHRRVRMFTHTYALIVIWILGFCTRCSLDLCFGEHDHQVLLKLVELMQLECCQGVQTKH